MYASHESCKELYDCSCDKLDSIIRIGKENKALGGRLTGAGWGGCAVLMAYKKDADEIMR
jgi:galactokinase